MRISDWSSDVCSSDLTPLAVARALVKRVRDLPTWTLRTGRLSETATRLRDRLKVADDPNRLLIDELPIAIGLEGADHSGADIAARILGALTELRDAYPAMQIGRTSCRESGWPYV